MQAFSENIWILSLVGVAHGRCSTDTRCLAALSQPEWLWGLLFGEDTVGWNPGPATHRLGLPWATNLTCLTLPLLLAIGTHESRHIRGPLGGLRTQFEASHGHAGVLLSKCAWFCSCSPSHPNRGTQCSPMCPSHGHHGPGDPRRARWRCRPGKNLFHHPHLPTRSTSPMGHLAPPGHPKGTQLLGSGQERCR